MLVSFVHQSDALPKLLSQAASARAPVAAARPASIPASELEVDNPQSRHTHRDKVAPKQRRKQPPEPQPQAQPQTQIPIIGSSTAASRRPLSAGASGPLRGRATTSAVTPAGRSRTPSPTSHVTYSVAAGQDPPLPSSSSRDDHPSDVDLLWNSPKSTSPSYASFQVPLLGQPRLFLC